MASNKGSAKANSRRQRARNPFTRSSPPKTRSATARARAQTKQSRSTKVSSKKPVAPIKGGRSSTRTVQKKDSTPVKNDGQPPENLEQAPVSLGRRRKGRPKKLSRGQVAKPAASDQSIIAAQPLPSADEALPSIETDPWNCQTDIPLPLNIDTSRSTSRSTSSGSVPWSIGPEATAVDPYYCRNGYVPSLDSRALEIIRLILGKAAALKMAKLRADHSRFSGRLSSDRNVDLKPHPHNDPYMAKLDKLELNLPENRAVSEVYSRLWTKDIQNCENENEALFQRTIMMSFVDRYRLIFGDTQGSETDKVENQTEIGSKLAFSTEVEWTCDPMPTRALQKDEEEFPYLASPKPDLCVSFRREGIIREGFWDYMPDTLKKLVTYEGLCSPHDQRAFRFLMVEVKRSNFAPGDIRPLGQALNDASQALHNMFEFFRQAGQEKDFFDRVRVFSATGSSEGVLIRIHRAVNVEDNPEALDARDPIPADPSYNLRFQFNEYRSFLGKDFDRQKVVETFARIMIGYGEGVLHGLFESASKKIDNQFRPRVQQKRPLDEIMNDYSHGQKPPHRSGRTSTQGSRTGSTSRVSKPKSLRRQATENRASRGGDANISGGGARRTGMTEDVAHMMSPSNSGPQDSGHPQGDSPKAISPSASGPAEKKFKAGK